MSSLVSTRSSEPTVVITPAITEPWLSKDQKDRSIALLDFEVDILNDQSYRFDIVIFFNAIRIRPSWSRNCFYFGCTGADIEIFGQAARIFNHTKDMEIPTEKAVTSIVERNTSIRIEPSYDTKSDNTARKLAIGGIGYQKGSKKEFLTKFSCAERVLAALKYSDRVKWDIKNVLGSINRDYLFGNLYLFATLDWSSDYPNGKIGISPSNVGYFDMNGQKVSKVTEICIEWALSKIERSKSKLEFEDGIVVNFVLSFD